MRIAYVVYGDLNQLAGNPVHTLEITKAWVKQGHEVTLIVPTFGVPRVANGARVLSVPTIGGGARGSLVFGLLTPLVLAGLRLRHEMDAVYASQMSLVVSPLLACLLLGIPYVTEVQGHLRNEIAMRRPDPVKDLVAGVTEWLTLRWSRAVVAVSEASRPPSRRPMACRRPGWLWCPTASISSPIGRWISRPAAGNWESRWTPESLVSWAPFTAISV